MQKNTGTNPVLRGFILRNVVFRFVRNLGKLGKQIPLEIQRVTKIRDTSSSSRLEKLSSLLSIRARMDLYQPTLRQKTFLDPVV